MSLCILNGPLICQWKAFYEIYNHAHRVHQVKTTLCTQCFHVTPISILIKFPNEKNILGGFCIHRPKIFLKSITLVLKFHAIKLRVRRDLNRSVFFVLQHFSKCKLDKFQWHWRKRSVYVYIICVLIIDCVTFATAHVRRPFSVHFLEWKRVLTSFYFTRLINMMNNTNKWHMKRTRLI